MKIEYQMRLQNDDCNKREKHLKRGGAEEGGYDVEEGGAGSD